MKKIIFIAILLLTTTLAAQNFTLNFNGVKQVNQDTGQKKEGYINTRVNFNIDYNEINVQINSNPRINYTILESSNEYYEGRQYMYHSLQSTDVLNPERVELILSEMGEVSIMQGNTILHLTNY